MKKKNLLVGLLSTAFVLTSAFAFSLCDDSSSEEHNWVSELTKPATCTEDGELTWICSHCSEVKVETVPALGHNFIDGVCGCGENDKKESRGLNYTLLDNDTYEVSGIGSCTDTDIIIPETYNGKAVTSIGDSVFYDCSSLTSIEIPDGITSIGWYAFFCCQSLTSVVIPDSVTSIGGGAFVHCISLTSIEIPDGITSIGNDAFYNCSSLRGMVIPDSVTSIGERAFYYCSSLTSVVIGDNVTSIGFYAFYECGSLTSVEIPDGVTSIGNYAFWGCSSLTSVVIGDSVATIGSAAFGFCKKLTSVYYKGTMESWGDIDISSMNGTIAENGTFLVKISNNEKLTNATRYYYSEEEPTEEGNYWHYDTDGVTPIVWSKEE